MRALFLECCWAVFLGACSAAGATILRLAFIGLQWCFTGHTGTLPAAAAALAPWRRVAIPIAGAAIALALQNLGKRRCGPVHDVDYVEAIQECDGEIPFRPTAWRTASAAFSIGSGAAVGREGVMIQFAGAFTSWLGTFWNVRALSLCRQVACGVAGGVATAYQAPVAAIFFAYEIALGKTARLRDLLPLTLASISGWLLSRPILGTGPLFPATGSLGHPGMLWLSVLPLAVLAGGLGPLYQHMVRGLGFIRKWPLSLALGGIAVGVLSLLTPEVWGNADMALKDVMSAGSHGTVATQATVLVLLVRLAATSVCIGAGTVGGVFTPTLFAGATLGLLVAHFTHSPLVLLFVLVGMGSLMSAVTHAPFMAACMTVELTGTWPALPLLLVCHGLSSYIARRISPDSLFGIATTEPARPTVDRKR